MCDNSVCIGLYNAASLRIFFCCFLLLPSVCIRIYFVFFKMSGFLVKRKPFFCLLSILQVPICVRNAISVHTDFRRHSFKFKNTEYTETRLLKWYQTQILRVMFLNEQPESGMYENWHTRRKISQSNPIKRFKSRIKRQCMMHRGFQNYHQDESPANYNSYIYISRQLGLKKADQYNKHQDLSVHWW
jgi:hypothetical protein